MSDSLYIIRNYSPADFDNYVSLNIEVEKLEPAGRCVSPQSISESLRQIHYSPEHDLFVAEAAGKIVGFMNITLEQHIRRVILDCLVHPGHRRQGMATKLLGCAVRRAQELKAKVAHVNIRDDNTVAGTALSRLGFNVVRRFIELRLDIADLPDTANNIYSYRHLQPGEEGILTRIQNRCFTGTWGYNPNTTEEIVQRLNMARCSLEDILLIFEEDKPIGYCWTIINREAEGTGAERIGRIHMMGVDPDSRGRGVGRAALLAGLSHLRITGIQVAELTVDSENSTACGLYQSTGFKVWTTSLWYEKAIG